MKYRISHFIAILFCTVFSFQCCIPNQVGKELQGQKPIIGVSPSFSKGQNSVGEDYCTAIRKAGGIPVILPLVDDDSQAVEAIALIDGLLMTGGEDVNPSYYGETPINETVKVNRGRDTSDFLLLEAAKERSLPVLGICRGEQIVNVFYGGSLIQDIPSQVGTEIRHSQSEPKSQGTHRVYLQKGTRLSTMMNADSLSVNSFHHQAVKKTAPDFIVSAVSADGIIEAYESSPRSKQKILCVQFHPEGFINAGDYTLLPIFQEFIKNCTPAEHIKRSLK